ncbi:MAG: hypothetical protein L6R38_008328 [Xanthoria sp. 2 TBL-2021]|nr:MAG: hypothetical protein L6R38_008328 [Xanthoria sp. 2 TBL-2021]
MTSITHQCDEIQPACGQCLKARRTCTGAAQGNQFINLLIPATSPSHSIPVPTRCVAPTEDTPKPSAEPSYAGKPSPLTVPLNHQSSRRKSHLYVSLPSDASKGFPSKSRSLALPTWYQPSKADIFQQHFTSHFIGNFFNPESFLAKQNGWAHHLPSVLSLVKSPAVEAAVRATTMAFYGIRSNDVAIKTEACRWYSKGLRFQRIELERASSAGQGFTANEWKRPPIIASEEWCNIPFSIHGKAIYDLLDDILIQLPACHILRRDYEALEKYGTSQEIERLALEVEAAGRALLHKLDIWWSVYGHISHDRSFDERVCPPLPINIHTDPPSGTFDFFPNKSFGGSWHAQKIAQFNAISIGGFGLLNLATKKSYTKEITAHGESILAAVSFDQDCNVGNTGSTSMLFPLIVLYHHSTSNRRLQVATKAALHAWSKPRGVNKFVREATPIGSDSAE